MGVASAFSIMIRFIGGIIGISVLGAVFNHIVELSLSHIPNISKVTLATGYTMPLHQSPAVVQGYTVAFRLLFLVLFPVALLSAILFAIVKTKIHKTNRQNKCKLEIYCVVLVSSNEL